MPAEWEARLPEVLALLTRRFGPLCVWLHGSSARGTARPDSDVDLAVLGARPLDARLLLETRLELGSLLARDVDLADLRGAGPILGMQVMKAGRLLRDDMPAARRLWEMQLPSRYEDLRLDRRPVERALRQRLGRA